MRYFYYFVLSLLFLIVIGLPDENIYFLVLKCRIIFTIFVVLIWTFWWQIACADAENIGPEIPPFDRADLMSVESKDNIENAILAWQSIKSNYIGWSLIKLIIIFIMHIVFFLGLWMLYMGWQLQTVWPRGLSIIAMLFFSGTLLVAISTQAIVLFWKTPLKLHRSVEIKNNKLHITTSTWSQVIVENIPLKNITKVFVAEEKRAKNITIYFIAVLVKNKRQITLAATLHDKSTILELAKKIQKHIPCEFDKTEVLYAKGDLIAKTYLGTLQYTVKTRGNKYVGKWRFISGRMHGKGIAYLKDGNQYVGNWINFKPHGHGVEYDGSGKIRKKGWWQLGQHVRSK